MSSVMERANMLPCVRQLSRACVWMHVPCTFISGGPPFRWFIIILILYLCSLL